MTLLHRRRKVSEGTTPAVDRLRDLLNLHFHPEWGSSYWLERQEQLGWDVRDRIRSFDDLWLLGPMRLADLRRFPVRAFIPKALHGQLPRFVLGETAGTSGEPCLTAYRDDEFQAAFVTPFLRVAQATGFPRGEPWLWVGPTGPHIIGKVARELARQTGSMDPFSVDFDPRWAKRLADGSTARQRYLDHVTTQALDVLQREEVAVLFTTPPALAALAARLSDGQREAIRGIHYGGMSLTPETVNDFRAAFPRAIHLGGYGNTLFGVVMEMADAHRLAMDYYPLGDRVQFHVVDWPNENPVEALSGHGASTGGDHAAAACTWPPRLCEKGESGRVLFHRLDESCLFVGVVERDQTERVASSPEAIALGGYADGLRNPHSPSTLAGRLQMGLY
jgi:thienamycin biosynthesis protein ThnN